MANPFVKAWKYLMALFSSKVDEYADPKVQIQQAIEEAQRQHQALTQQAASVIGNQRQLEMRLSRQLADIEKLREHLGIDRWQVFGGSWGSTLALAYAQAHARRVSALVLRGIFMLRRWELEWFYQEGASRLFPEAWEHYVAAIPESEHGDMIAAFHRRLTSDDEATRLAAARAWSVWEGATSFLHVDQDFVHGHDDPHFALAFARIENHYFVNGGFFEVDDQLLRDIYRIVDIPGVIVHGRYAVVCPVQNAWDLHRAWPKSELVITPASGHSAFEPENVDALVQATDRFANA